MSFIMYVNVCFSPDLSQFNSLNISWKQPVRRCRIICQDNALRVWHDEYRIFCKFIRVNIKCQVISWVVKTYIVGALVFFIWFVIINTAGTSEDKSDIVTFIFSGGVVLVLSVSSPEYVPILISVPVYDIIPVSSLEFALNWTFSLLSANMPIGEKIE
jgi:hypothetical protein